MVLLNESIVTSKFGLNSVNVEGLVNHSVFITRKVEVRLLEGELLTTVVGISVNGKGITVGNIDTLDGEGPAEVLEVRNVTAEREELTLLVNITVDNGAGHGGSNGEFSETEGFITSTLIVVNVDLDFSSRAKVRNNDGGGVLGIIIPASTANIARTTEVILLGFVGDNTINVNNDGIVGIDGVNEESIQIDGQERVRREISEGSGGESTGTGLVETTEELLGIRASTDTIAVISSPLTGIEIVIIEEFLDGNLRLVNTVVGQNVEVSETPRSSVSIVGGNVSLKGNGELRTRDGDGDRDTGLSIGLSTTADVGRLGVELSGVIRTNVVNQLVVNQKLEQGVLISATFPTGKPLIEQN